MTALTDFCTVVRAWVDDVNPDDTMITSWIRMAEERLNNELRSNEQIVRDYATFDDNCAVLPDDWLEVLYVRSGNVFRYVTPDAYWQTAAQPTRELEIADPTGAAPWPPPGAQKIYTIIGRTLFVLPNIDPAALTKIEVGYYRALAPLGDTMDPVLSRYPSLLLNCTLSAAAPYLVEDDRLSTFAALATAGIEKVNNSANSGRWSGSPLTPMIKGFG
jgi:hypothetical protein